MCNVAGAMRRAQRRAVPAGKNRVMFVCIDEETLNRLVIYESRVKKKYSLAARRRLMHMDYDAIRDYEKIKEMTDRISSLVDFAFRLYGVQNGFMKPAEEVWDPRCCADLEELADQLRYLPCSVLSQKESAKEAAAV
jgi:hypothetical protein